MSTIVQLSQTDIYTRTCDNYKATQSYLSVLRSCMELTNDETFKEAVSRDRWRCLKWIVTNHESWVRTMLEVSDIAYNLLYIIYCNYFIAQVETQQYFFAFMMMMLMIMMIVFVHKL